MVEKTAESDAKELDRAVALERELDYRIIDDATRTLSGFMAEGYEYIPADLVEDLIRALGRTAGASYDGARAVTTEGALRFMADEYQLPDDVLEEQAAELEALSEEVVDLKKKLSRYGESFNAIIIRPREQNKTVSLLGQAAEALSKVPGQGGLVAEMRANQLMLENLEDQTVSQVTYE